MKSAVLFLLLCCTAFAQSPVNPRTVESRSKQFIIRAGRAFDAFVPRVTNGRTLDLDPSLVAVSAERIKILLLRQLQISPVHFNSTGYGEGKIFIILQEERSPEVFAEAIKTPAGWSYRLEMPRQIEPPDFVEAIVSTLLLDLANQGNSGTKPELPAWLKRGMTEYLQSLSFNGLSLQQDQKTSRVEHKVDPLAVPREIFTRRQPLAFEEISWPDQLGSKSDLFGPSTHLLVHYLLEENGGAHSMRQFLSLLKHRKNWQTALLESFPAWESIMDVEKWWAVTMVQFTAIDPASAWPREKALPAFEKALRVPVQVREATEALPFASTAELETVILGWDNLRQEMGLQTVLRQLRAIRPRLPADLVDLNDDYCSTLESYLGQQAARNFGSRTLGQSTAALKNKTGRILAGLNSRLEEIKKMPMASARDEAIKRALEATAPNP